MQAGKGDRGVEGQPILGGPLSNGSGPLQNGTPGPAAEGGTRQSRLQALQSGFTRLRTAAVTTYQGARPWSEMFREFSKPQGFYDAMSRIRQNVQYFYLNYSIVMVATLAACMFSNPGSIITLIVLGTMWMFVFLRDAPLRLPGMQREYSPREQIVFVGIVSFVVVFFFSKVFSIMMYALMVGMVLIGVHGAFRQPVVQFNELPQGAPGAVPGTAPGVAQGVPAGAAHANAVLGMFQGALTALSAGGQTRPAGHAANNGP